MKRQKLFTLLTVLTLLVTLVSVASGAAPAAPPMGASVRVIVELADAPLAVYKGSVPGLAATMAADGKLDVAAPEAQAYLNYLGERHVAFTNALAQALPSASVANYLNEQGVSKALDYRVVFNGMTINVQSWDRATAMALLGMPGVKAVYPEREYQVNLDVSHDLMGSAGMWTAAGGQANAGAGIKVAVLDTGIDEEHPFFDPTGFSYPPGYPKGDTTYTTEKVIVARGYYRPDDPPVSPGPTDYDSHGTGTAGIVAGNVDTSATISNTFGGVTQVLSGVAPAAQLMNYQIFYTAVSGSQSAWNPEILAAIEDTVADGADVSSNSWGGVDNLNPAVDPIGTAFQNAIDAGMVVVKSAGNSGDAYNSLGDAMPQDVIIAGGSDMGRRVAASASVIGPPGTVIPGTLVDMLAIPSDFGGPDLTGIISGTYVYVGRTQPANFQGCNPFDATTAAALAGNIALISRGACNFTVKVENAEAAGAVAAIVFNNVIGGLPIVMGGSSSIITIPSVMVGNVNGLDMADFEAAHPGTAEVEINPALTYIPDAALPFTMYQSSSRGPDLVQEIGVDIIAPGQSVWTSYSADGGWNTVSGTSFSCPFASGGAAVLLAMNPTWDHADIKSAMISTAKTQGIYNDYARTEPAGVLDMGGGHLMFDGMVDPGLVFDKSSLSFKQMMVGTSKTFTIEATDVFERGTAALEETYTVTVSETGDVTTTANFDLSVDVATLVFDNTGDTASFDVTMEIPAGATPGDYEGWVWLRSDRHEAHLPVWVRVRPEMMENHVLVLDDDASAYGFPDYLDYYTDALDTLDYTYDVWAVDLANYYTGRGLPTIAEMQAYDKIVWFTGDSYYTYYEIGAELQSRNDVLGLLQSGGAKVLATGQDLTGYEYAGNPDEQYLFQVGMAASPLQEDAYAPAGAFTPNPAVEGTSDIAAFDGMAFDLGTPLVGTPVIGDGAGNQFYVDELVPYGTDPVPYGGRGFLRSLEPGSDDEGWVGIVRSMDPTLENEGVLPGPDYRTIYLSFGLEGINNDTGFNTREELMMHAFNFLQDDLQATLTITGTETEFDLVSFAVEATQTFTGTAGLPETLRMPAQIVQVRWDFGDGSPYFTSDVASIQRQYTRPGAFTVRAEVMDQYGHTVLVSGKVEVGHVLYLPLVSRN